MKIPNATINIDGTIELKEIEVEDNFFNNLPTQPSPEERLAVLEAENTRLIEALAALTTTEVVE